MQGYEHLNLEEREKFFGWKQRGLSLRAIARRLNRSASTLSKELKKNTKYGKAYLPCVAQRRAERVGARQRYKAPLKGLDIFLYVREHLRAPHFWTPQMICGRIGMDISGAAIDTETIYRYIYSRQARTYRLWEYLPCARKKRMKKFGRKVRNRGRVPNALSIDMRPKGIEARTQAGHWETDNVEGPKTSKPALSVTVERKSRFHIVSKIPNQTALVKSNVLVKRLSTYPTKVRRSITQDNGKENYAHEQTQIQLGTDMYFCHAYHSWEKGTVENRNSVLRRFLPKGTDFTKVSEGEIKEVERILNNMPMKCLQYKTPHEKMQQVLARLRSA